MSTRIRSLNIEIQEGVYLKAPQSSVLGGKIISGSIDLIEEMGFEDFTFKKLAVYIESTEASIYRYFESKHHVLTYLVLWYWGWQEYRLVFGLTNISDPAIRLRKAISLLTAPVMEDSDFSQINEVKLNRIVISEGAKVFLSKKVDLANANGFFLQYKHIVQMVSDIILEINPEFKYPHMLVSTVIEGAHHQRFFSEHLPRLTDQLDGEDSVSKFYIELVFKEIV
jgi:AcrR family transcriptional regulator